MGTRRVGRVLGALTLVAGSCALGVSSASAVTTPSITSSASPSTSIGLQIHDVVDLSNGTNPTGSISYTLYGPADPGCTSAVVTTTTPVTGNGAYASQPFTTTKAGTYQWVASYSGDDNNSPVSPTPCDDPSESVTVQRSNAGMTTTASPGVTLGGTVNDSATLNGFSPTGDIDFNLFGVGDTFCSGTAVFTAMVPVTGSGTYVSPNFTPTAAGTYNWKTSYTGDGNNLPVAGTACPTTGETVTVVAGSKATPTISTTPSASVAVGGTVTDSATLLGGSSPTGTVTFRLYSPSDATCTGLPAFSSLTSVAGGSATSGPSVTTAAGTYQWTASYSGDGSNNAVASDCGSESVAVTKADTTLTSQASGPVDVGGAISDTATLSGGFSPTGTISFALYGPNDTTCSGTPPFTATHTTDGDGPYTSDPFTTTAPGTYHWVTSFGGDANSNPSAATACTDPTESVVVSEPTTSTTTSTTSTTVPTGTTTTTSSTSTTVPTGTTTTTSSTSTTVPTGTTTTTSSTSTTVPTGTTTTTTTVPGTTTTVPGTTTTSTSVPGTTTTSTSVPGTTTTSTTVPSTTTSSTSVPGTTTSSTSTTVPAGTTTTTSTTVPGATTTTLAPTVRVQPSTVAAGQTVLVSGTGVPAGSELDIDLFSNGVLIGTTTANSLGNYEVTVTIPSSTVPGTHTVVVETVGGVEEAQTTLTVTTATAAAATTTTTQPSSLSFTGANVQGPGQLALLLLISGLVALAVTWRRRPISWRRLLRR